MSMGIPFNLLFFSDKNTVGDLVISFSTDLEEALKNLEEYSYSCTELCDLRVKFECNQPDAKLWIEIMDMLPEKSFRDSETVFFHPSQEIRGLYLNFESDFNTDNLNFSCLLPGVYRMVVTVHDEEYYAFLKVTPSRIHVEQLNLMRGEIEGTLVDLAKETAVRRNFAGFENDSTNESITRKYDFLISNSVALINNINLILREPRFKITKKYMYKSLGQPTRSDLKTTQLKQSRHTSTHKVPSYDYIIDYNLSINSNLKKMLEEFLDSIFLVEKYVKKKIVSLKNDLALQKRYKSPTDIIDKKLVIEKERLEQFKKLKANVILALEENWFENVDAHMNNQEKLTRFPYYRTIYSLYLQLNKGSTFTINPFKHYIYYWKETSKLYEIWGFIKLLLMLKNNKYLNFNEISGWIFDHNDDSIYPFLDPNTKITLRNSEGLVLNVWYDSFISKPPEKADTFDNPLITVEKSNRPDFRMDIYDQGVFKGSVLADFKYRSYDKLGTLGVYTRNRDNNQGYKVYSQLVNYSNVRSFYYNTTRKTKYANPAIKRVFGIFPQKENKSNFFESDDATTIIRCSLSPGVEFKDIENEFLDIIEEATGRELERGKGI